MFIQAIVHSFGKMKCLGSFKKNILLKHRFKKVKHRMFEDTESNVCYKVHLVENIVLNLLAKAG